MSEPIPLLGQQVVVATCAWESDNAGCGNTIDVTADIIMGVVNQSQVLMLLAAESWSIIGGKAYCPDCREGVWEKSLRSR